MWICKAHRTWWGGCGCAPRTDRESASFEYDPSWLSHPERFSLEPALNLGPGAFHTASDQPLFGAIGDSAPDRWGRVLMRRAERRRAEREGQTPRTLRELDYLLMVDDEARMGALRFARQGGGPFLAEYSPAKIPPLNCHGCSPPLSVP
jgi:serine/threonine-protein kinase HipA